jgi:hypothetical protein
MAASPRLSSNGFEDSLPPGSDRIWPPFLAPFLA